MPAYVLSFPQLARAASAIRALACAALFLLAATGARAQRVIGTVNLNGSGNEAAVNPVTNLIYTANRISGTVSGEIHEYV
jgi:hypothetical protein